MGDYRWAAVEGEFEKKPKSVARLSNETMLAANNDNMAALWGGNTALTAKYVNDSH